MALILVVDDLAVFREPIAGALRAEGFEVCCAANGAEALRLIGERTPGLILLDIVMPPPDGMKVLRILRASPRFQNIPVIMFTEVRDRRLVVEAAKLGIVGYVLKSQFSFEAMLKMIRTALAGAGTGATGAAAASAGVSVPKGAAAASMASSAVVATAARPSPPSPPPRLTGFSGAPGLPGVLGVPAAQRLQGLQPIMSRADVEAKLDASGALKVMSPTVTQIIHLTGSAGCSMDSIAKVIVQDPGISVKILKLANSAVYQRSGDPVDSVHRAVKRIGLSQVRQMVINIGVVDRFGDTSTAEGLNASHFWEHSIGTGLIAGDIMRALRASSDDAEAAFTMGMLHDVGRMVYLDVFGSQYSKALTLAEELDVPVEAVESRLFHINHAEAMDRMLKQWNFPRSLVVPVSTHHLSVSGMRRASPRGFEVCAALALANRLAHALLIGGSGNQTVYPIEEFVEALDLDHDAIAQIESDVPPKTTTVKLIFLAQSNQQAWKDPIEAFRGGFRQPVRPTVVSRTPDIDTVRIFCGRIAQFGGEAPPNLMIAHLHKAADQGSITGMIKEVEAKAGLANLPTLIVSPKGDLDLEGIASTGRAVRRLALPFTLAHFVQAVNEVMPAVADVP